MHILFISSPKRTLAGTVAKRRHYKVLAVDGSVARTITLNKLCAEQHISSAGMLQKLKKFTSGQYETSFQEIIDDMRAHRRGAQGTKKLICPYCSKGFINGTVELPRVAQVQREPRADLQARARVFNGLGVDWPVKKRPALEHKAA
jgi:hypothetical protein